MMQPKWRLTELILPSLVISVYVGIVLPTSTLEGVQFAASDLVTRFRVWVRGRPVALQDFVLVSIDDESIRRVNQRWPWDRRLLAEAIDRVQAAGPRLICLDLILAGATTPESDGRLADTLTRAGNVVLASYVGIYEEPVPPYQPFALAARATGSVNKPRDRDLRIRSARVVQLSSTLKAEDYSLEAKAAAALLQASSQFQDGTLAFLDGRGRVVRSVPVRPDGTVAIDYTFRETDLPTVPIHQVFQSAVREEDFRGKVVLFGATGRMFHETYATPLGSQSGVVVLANTLETLHGGKVPVEVPLNLQWLLLGLSGVIAALAVSRGAPLRGLLVSGGLLAVFIVGSLLAGLRHYTWDFIGVPFTVLGVSLIGTFQRSARLGIEAARLRLQATTDSLTGVANLRYLETRLQHELIRAQRYGMSLAVVMFDVDEFKSVNDRYGHACGNDLLSALVDRVRHVTRLADLIARYGGDEFCIILFHTDAAGGLAYAEHLRTAVAERPLPTRVGPLSVTISIGVAVAPPDDLANGQRLLEQADAALYRSKLSGKNAAALYESPQATPR